MRRSNGRIRWQEQYHRRRGGIIALGTNLAEAQAAINPAFMILANSPFQILGILPACRRAYCLEYSIAYTAFALLCAIVSCKQAGINAITLKDISGLYFQENTSKHIKELAAAGFIYYRAKQSRQFVFIPSPLGISLVTDFAAFIGAYWQECNNTKTLPDPAKFLHTWDKI